jgi:hypothetical protein
MKEFRHFLIADIGARVDETNSLQSFALAIR